MIGRIVNQLNFQLITVGKGDHPFDELRPTTGIFRTVVQINRQLPDRDQAFLVGRPPPLDTVGDKVTGLPRGTHEDRQPTTYHLQQAKGY